MPGKVTYSQDESHLAPIQTLLTAEGLPFTIVGIIGIDDPWRSTTVSLQVLRSREGSIVLAGFATIHGLIGQTFRQESLNDWYLQIVAALMVNSLPLPYRICSTVFKGEGPFVEYQIPKLNL